MINIVVILIGAFTLSLFITVLFLHFIIKNKKNKKDDNNLPIPPDPKSNKHRQSYKCIDTGNIGNEYNIIHDWKGSDLRPEKNNGWEYFVAPDPTHGLVSYGAYSSLMRDVDGEKMRIDVGTIKNPTDFRKSIRLDSVDDFDEGLFIIKADHIPEGLGTWPAFWLSGDVKGKAKWACYGEIDIIEGINSFDSNTSYNTTSLHTSDVNNKSCNQISSSNTVGLENISNGGECGFGKGDPKLEDRSCGCDGKSKCPYGGCGVNFKCFGTQKDLNKCKGKPPYDNSFGWGFNQNGGGVYACELTKDGFITIWFFPNGEVPCDIEKNKPDPSKWTKNIAVKFAQCKDHFQKMKIIINTTLCGDWAGAAYDDGTGTRQIMGNKYNGFNECKAVVQNPGYDVSQAYWLIDYIKVFRKK